MINQGDQAPALKVSASDGVTVDLAAPSAPLVLYFYPKDRNGSECLKLLSCADNCLLVPGTKRPLRVESSH